MFRSVCLLCAFACVPLTGAGAQIYATGEASYEPFTLQKAPPFQPGTYEVTASLEHPGPEHSKTTTTRKLCLVERGGAGTHGLEAIGEASPLAHCPAVNVQEHAGSLTFDIECAGSNPAKASATYVLLGDRFHGLIAPTTDEKNSSVTEVQEGHRIADCRPPS